MNKGLFTILAAVAMVAAGCAKDSKKNMSSGGVTDLSSPTASAAQPAYTPPPSVAQPVVSETPAATATPVAMSTDASSGASSSAIGSSYKVKKGDTLFSIAKAKYGDGKQWHKIASANPGVSPQSLKVGQTLSIPQ